MEPNTSADSTPVISLYHDLLDCWNRRAADDFGALFAEAGNVIGFDGSQIDGRAAVAAHLSEIFAHHQTPAYVGKVRELRFLAADVAVLRAVAGLVPPGQSELNPALNAIQTLLAARRDGLWRIELYQNTPAAFHGRPDLSEALTEELRNALRDARERPR